MIRGVELNDAGAICDVYNYYIENTTITFEEVSVSIDEMKNRIKKLAADYSWIVYEIDGKIVGYAYATKWKARSAYRYTVESTVYVDVNYRGKGVGISLYKHLLRALENGDFHSVIGVIALPNTGSIELHEKLGFEKVAHFKEVGYKHRNWIDVGYWQYKFHK